MTSASPGGGIQPEEDGRLQCLECGRWLRQLASHLGRVHGISADDYRDRHQLPAQLGLRAADLREKAAEQGRQRIVARPDIRAHLDAGRLNTSPSSMEDGQRRTARRSLVREARATAAHAKRAQALVALNERARALGAADLTAFLTARRDRPLRAVGAELGVSRQTVGRWMEHLGVRSVDHSRTRAYLQQTAAPDGRGSLADWLRRQAAERRPLPELAERTGRDKTVVDDWLKTLAASPPSDECRALPEMPPQ